MAKKDYRQSQAVTKKLLQDFGAPVLITLTTESTFDEDTLENTTDTNQFIANGVLVNFTDKDRSNSHIEQEDRKLLLDPVGLPEPQLKDKVEAEGTTYTIKQSMTVNPAGIPVVYIYRVGK